MELKMRSPVSALLRESRMTSTRCALMSVLRFRSLFTSTNASPGANGSSSLSNLVLLIRLQPLLLINPVAVTKIEQRTRRNRNDQFFHTLVSHDPPSRFFLSSPPV